MLKSDQPKAMDDAFAEQPNLAPRLKKVWDLAEGYKGGAYRPDVEAGWQQFRRQIEAPAPVRTMRPRPRTWRWPAAAAVLLLLGLSIWRFGLKEAPAQWTRVENTSLSAAERLLPDGTRIWLNSRSTLMHEANLDERAERRVRLEGEAIFHVAKDAGKTFIIRTANAEVEVLGTRFNLRAFPREGFTEVEVEEGSVALRDLASGREIVLTRNMRGRVNASGELEQEQLPELHATAWKERRMVCRGTELGVVQAVLQRTISADIRFADARLSKCRVTGVIDLDQPRPSLEAVCLATGLTLSTLETNNLVISGRPCR